MEQWRMFVKKKKKTALLGARGLVPPPREPGGDMDCKPNSECARGDGSPTWRRVPDHDHGSGIHRGAVNSQFVELIV